MSYENKPMKMQWIEVNGRSTPIILPQYWDEEKQDWIVTDENNPLPVKFNEPQNVQLTGSNMKLKDIIADSSTPVDAGGTKVIEIVPPEGVIWRTPLIWAFARISGLGATTGKHTVELMHGINHYRYLVLRAESSYDKFCRIMGNVAESADAGSLPTEQVIQHSAIQNLIISKEYPLYVKYTNSTDATNKDTFELRLIVTEERVSQ